MGALAGARRMLSGCLGWGQPGYDAGTGAVAWSRPVGNDDLGSYLAVVGDVLAVSLSDLQESSGGPMPLRIRMVNEGFDPATGDPRTCWWPVGASSSRRTPAPYAYGLPD